MKKELIKYIAFGVIIILLITYFKQCSEPEYIIEYDTTYIIKKDSTLFPVAVVYPLISEVDKIIYVDKYKDSIQIDTVIKYITKYLAKNTYKDTLIDNDTAFICITDIIHKNLIEERTSEITLYNKTIIKDVKPNGFLFGVGSTTNENTILNIQGGYQFKKSIFTLGYSANKEIIFNYYYKL